MRGVHHYIPLALLAASMPSGKAQASENGNQHYPVGVNTVANGVLPPPGVLSLYNYSQINTNDALVGPDGKPLVPEFSLDAQVNAARFLYTLKPAIGPFHYTIGLVVPVVHAKLNVDGLRSSKTRIGDLDFENYLGYVSQDHKLFAYVGLDTYIPTGAYKCRELLNIGSNYWTFMPNVDVTYNPSPKVEISVTATAQFNTNNHATDYHSGSMANLDYGITWRPFRAAPKFGFGVQGYFLQQLSDDTVKGERVSSDGFRGREYAIGPQVRYDWRFGGIIAKYQKEFSVENRPKGNRFWIEIAAPLAGAPRAHSK